MSDLSLAPVVAGEANSTLINFQASIRTVLTALLIFLLVGRLVQAVYGLSAQFLASPFILPVPHHFPVYRHRDFEVDGSGQGMSLINIRRKDLRKQKHCA